VRHIVVGTAGHIDHGKSALVEALTGVHPDRLEEEKRRGITIDLGFADCELPPDGVVGLVDVPGHERFVRHMVAGASGIDAVLLVVAADEGIKPQTEEHVAICGLLGLTRGIVVLTKADLVEPDLREVAAIETREFLEGTFLEASPLLTVSARTGEGIGSVRDALRDLLRHAVSRPSGGVPRLPVDRAFVLKGFGTVVTGTLVSGTLREGDEVEILPGDKRGRIRGLQVHGKKAQAAEAGRRVAVNLQGLDCAEAPRGSTVTAPAALRTTRRALVIAELLPGAPPALKRGGAIRFHIGTCERAARLRFLPSHEQGGPNAEVVLSEETVLLPADRFVLRRPAPFDTVGGGIVLDAHPPRGRRVGRGALRHARPGEGAAILERIARTGVSGCPPEEVARELGLSAAEVDALAAPLQARDDLVRAAGRLVAGEAWRAAGRSVSEALAAFHAAEPLRAGMPREALRARAVREMPPEIFRELLSALAGEGSVRLLGERVAIATHRVVLSPTEAALASRIDETFRNAGLDPPSIDAVLGGSGEKAGAPILEHLIEEGRLVKIRDGRLFHAEALDALRRKVRAHARTSSTMDVGTFKEIAGVTRKNAIPLLEQLDAERVTRRVGNLREILENEATK
jgi:selenocysteine-specific elongation factor